LSSRVLLPGEQNDIPAWLNAFDVFVQPSLLEGMSNTIVEAMAAERAVVATRIGGNPELVTERKSGLMFEVQQPRALADLIFQLAASPGLRESLGREARARVKGNFSLEAMLARYSKLYCEVAGGSHDTSRPVIPNPRAHEDSAAQITETEQVVS